MFIQDQWLNIDITGYDSVCRFRMQEQTRWILEAPEYKPEFSVAVLRFHDRRGFQLFTVHQKSRSMAVTARLVVRRNVAGIMTFPMIFDDYLGKCPIDTDTYDDFNVADGVDLHIPTRNETNFPLMRTINEALLVAVDERNQEAKLHHE